MQKNEGIYILDDSELAPYGTKKEDSKSESDGVIMKENDLKED